ncbi:zinc-binding metallopeptidase family protein [Acidovorax lacteus]|uniref:Zinc-binding peptidase n=1 Tax=Acidovorax lacteus TaxID=1924988 RepID=A0ABP8L7Y5_9BURK
MRVFNCSHCGHLVFFDSVQCLHCHSTLAFDPHTLSMRALEPAGSESAAGVLRARGAASAHAPPATPGPVRYYRLCRNHTLYQACNFAVDADDSNPWCASCRQTRTLPNLADPAHLRRWRKIEAAKRHLFYTLARLGLEHPDAARRPRFEFLADQPGKPAVLTGHLNGMITLNVAEADDDERARRRVAMGEPYRTLIGHLRHESGHFFWDSLVRDGGPLDAFRQLFGDERADYAAALRAHYARGGPPAGWEAQHVSAYATAHPWEDWAETWAHYLHLIDLLETAASYSAGFAVPDPQSPQRFHVHDPFAAPERPFDAMVREWVPLTLMLNSLNRSLGQDDAYPFALSAGAMHKLQFVHDLVRSQRTTASSLSA